jgi:DNA-binding CsgD family transcriptional regulator
MPNAELPDLPLPADRWARLAASLSLPPQQLRIVELILRNQSDKEIAAALNLKAPTVRSYLNRIFERVGVRSRMELVLMLFAMSHELEDEV